MRVSARKWTGLGNRVLRHQPAQGCVTSCMLTCFSCAAMVFRYSQRARTFFFFYLKCAFENHVTRNSAVPDPSVWPGAAYSWYKKLRPSMLFFLGTSRIKTVSGAGKMSDHPWLMGKVAALMFIRSFPGVVPDQHQCGARFSLSGSEYTCNSYLYSMVLYGGTNFNSTVAGGYYFLYCPRWKAQFSIVPP